MARRTEAHSPAGGAAALGARAFFTGAAASATFFTGRSSRVFFFACALRRFIFNELRRSSLPMVRKYSSERKRGAHSAERIYKVQGGGAPLAGRGRSPH